MDLMNSLLIGISFMATKMPLFRLMPLQTFPYAPFPIYSISWQFQMVLFLQKLFIKNNNYFTSFIHTAHTHTLLHTPYYYPSKELTQISIICLQFINFLLMNAQKRFREKYEECKRKSLLKRIRFYEKLIDSSGVQNHFIPGHQIKSKTSAQFFPILAPLSPDEQGLCLRPSKYQTFSNDSFNQEPEVFVSISKQTPRSTKRQTFRINKRPNIDNISELITKSMTPSIRVSKKSIEASKSQTHRIAKIKPESFGSQKSQTKRRQLNFERWAGISDINDTKQQKKEMFASGPFQKQSISPWEIDGEFLY